MRRRVTILTRASWSHHLLFLNGDNVASWQSGVHHTPAGTYLEGQLALSTAIRLAVRVPIDAPIQGVFLRCSPDGEEQTIAAHRTADRPGYRCRWWEVEVHPPNPRFHYRFLLKTDDGVWWFSAAGMTRSVPTDHTDFQLLVERKEESWLDTSVFYQIFPDRFAVGNPAHRVQSGGHLVDGKPVVARAWGELPNEQQGAREFYGGDLDGITGKLPYLNDRLGVNALYLNPIFSAPSSHKYDVASYHDVDPHFGGEAAFLRLRQASKERAMRIILDVVPNHCGIEHPWFQSALRDAGAETAEFFTFHSHPESYEAWLGIASLPKLNYQSQKLKEAMYLASDSVFQRWLKPPYEIDGWRLDVANMLARQGSHHLGHKVLRGIRRAVKGVDPSAYLLGESFFDASGYLQGDQLDASMNYRGFMMPLYHWLSGRDYHAFLGREWGDFYPLPSSELDQQWRSFRATVPWAVTRHQLNLLDSHDTPRLLRMVDGDRRRAAVARLLLFTYPGVPCVYYGDEIGLDGGRDPDNRRCMPWDEASWDQQALAEWTKLIFLRRSLPALAGGAYQSLLAQENTLAFLRESRGSRLVTVARRDPDSVTAVPVEAGAIPDGAVFRDALGDAVVVVEGGMLPIHGGLTQLWVESASEA
jgi:alpha-glucosidase